MSKTDILSQIRGKVIKQSQKCIQKASQMNLSRKYIVYRVQKSTDFIWSYKHWYIVLVV